MKRPWLQSLLSLRAVKFLGAILLFQTALAGVARSENSRALQQLIESGEVAGLTQARVTDFFNQLSAEEVIQSLDRDSLFQILIANGFIRPDISTPEQLLVKVNEKGIDSSLLKLRAYGYLTALNDARGEGSLFRPDISAHTPFEDTNSVRSTQLRTHAVLYKLVALFHSNPSLFLDQMSLDSYLRLLGARDDTEPSLSSDPIYGVFTNDFFYKNTSPTRSCPDIYCIEAIPSTNFLVAPLPIDDWSRNLDQVSTNPSILSRFDSAIAALRAKPPGQRFVQLHATVWMPDFPAETPNVDYLRDVQGRILYKVTKLDAQGNVVWAIPPGNTQGLAPVADFTASPTPENSSSQPFRFPSMEPWVQYVRRRLPPVVRYFRQKLPSDVAIERLIVDYERTDLDWGSMVQQFKYLKYLVGTRSHTAILFQDPRTVPLLQRIGFSPAQISALQSESLDYLDLFPQEGGSSYGIRWNAFMVDEYNTALDRALYQSFREEFPNIQIVNWKQNIHTDLVPGRDFHGLGAALGLKNLTPGLIPAEVLYGGQGDVRTPAGKIAISDPSNPPLDANGYPQISSAAYYTIQNAFAQTIQKALSVSAASELRTAHFVANPGWKDGIQYLTGNGCDSIGLYGQSARHNPVTGRIEGGEELGTTMAELWYAVAAQADLISVYTSRSFADSGELDFMQRTMNEINEVLGYNDRSALPDAKAEINGGLRWLGEIPIQYDRGRPPAYENRDFVIWGAKANGKRIYRIFFDFDKLGVGATRNRALINDGTNGEPAEFHVGTDRVRIPHTRIFTPVVEVSKRGYWLVQDRESVKLLSDTISSFRRIIDRPPSNPQPPSAPPPDDGNAAPTIVLAENPLFTTSGKIAARVYVTDDQLPHGPLKRKKLKPGKVTVSVEQVNGASALRLKKTRKSYKNRGKTMVFQIKARTNVSGQYTFRVIASDGAKSSSALLSVTVP